MDFADMIDMPSDLDSDIGGIHDLGSIDALDVMDSFFDANKLRYIFNV
jgi:hypothetical protein